MEDARVDYRKAWLDTEELLRVYEEFYRAWWEVEKGVTDFDLHADAVTRLSEAHAAVILLHARKTA